MHITKKEYEEFVARGFLPDNKPLKSKADDPYKSKMERQYAWHLAELQGAGKIAYWAYEPVTLVIVDAGGNRCRYTPDFLVVWNTGLPILRVEYVEIKGYLREAARLRFLAARERYPFWKFTMLRKSKSGWEEVL